MSAPTGLGIWIAFLHQIQGGLTSAVARAKAIGAKWIAPRVGVDGINDGAFKLEHIAEYKAAGLGCYPWIFTKPATWPGFITAAKRLVDAGADGIIIDAEQAWDVDTRGEGDAQLFASALRRTLGEGVWIADAPWPWISKHSGFPADAFARCVDARLPQVYSTEIGTTVQRCLDETDREWSAWEQRFSALVRPRYPILTTYSKVTPVVVADVIAALDAYGEQPISLYSLEAMLPELEAALVARASAANRPTPLPSTLPAPADPTDPRLEPHHGEGSTLAEDIHELIDDAAPKR